MSEEEKKAIETLEIEGTENNYLEVKILLNLVDKQQKEIEEKTTILLAGAEKVKQLEKGNRSLMESRIKWKNRYYKEKVKNKEKIEDLETKLAIEKIDNKYNQEERDEETIPRYKIIDILNYLNDTDLNNYEIVTAFRKMMKELLEDDGDHIPRID